MYIAVRAKRILTFAGEQPARTEKDLTSPIPFIEDAVIVAQKQVGSSRILAVEPYADFKRRVGVALSEPLLDLGEASLLPGVHNCHTHLELSHLQGSTVLGKGFLVWLQSLLASIERSATEPEKVTHALHTAFASLTDYGVACVGDISSRAPEEIAALAQEYDVAAHIFLELYGYDSALLQTFATLPEAPPKSSFSPAGHALYSTSPEILRATKEWCRQQQRTFSMHLAEHPDETECLLTGRGDFAQLLRQRLLPQAWSAPGMEPVALADSYGLLDSRTLAVHCTQCSLADSALLAERGTWVCLCPRSNAGIGVGMAPVRAMLHAGVGLCLGTDSLASAPDLNPWNEARVLAAQGIAPAALLRMLTVNGAAALGELLSGTLEYGKRFCYTRLPEDFIGMQTW